MAGPNSGPIPTCYSVQVISSMTEDLHVRSRALRTSVTRPPGLLDDEQSPIVSRCMGDVHKQVETASHFVVAIGSIPPAFRQL